MWSNYLNLFHYYCFKWITSTRELCGGNLAENIFDSLKNTETFNEPIHVQYFPDRAWKEVNSEGCLAHFAKNCMQLKNIGPGDAVQKNMLPLFSIRSSVFSFQIFIFSCKNNKRLIIHIFLSIYHYKSYHSYLKRLCNSLCPNKNMKFVKVMFLRVPVTFCPVGGGGVCPSTC